MNRTLRSVAFLALVLSGCSSEVTEQRHDDVGILANDLTFLDDFETHAIDGVWRWADGETARREIDGGEALLLARTVPAELPGRSGTNTRLIPRLGGEAIDEIAATLTPLDYESIGSESRTAVGLYFQPEEDRGTNLHLVGLRIGLRSTDLETLQTRILSFACADEACLGSTPFPIDRGDFPQGRTSPVGEPRRFTVRIDREQDVVELDVDGATATVKVADLPYVTLDDFYFADIRAQNRFVDEPGDEARMEVSVDDVWIDGALYDDFAASPLDLDKWEEGDFVRTAASGELVLAMGSADPGTDVRLPLRDPEKVREMAALVHVEEWSWSDEGERPPIARVGGFWFGDGSLEGEDGANGQVYASVGIEGDDVRWYVARCLSNDCSSRDVLGEDSLGTTSVGAYEDLYIAWNGTHFTFQRNGEETASFSPVTAGVPPIVDRSIWKGVQVRFPHAFAGTGYMRAGFDEIRTNPTGTIALGTEGVSDSWSTEANGGAFLGLVAFGPDPDDPSRVLLHATRGATDGEICNSSSCDFLQLSMDVVDLSGGATEVTVRDVAYHDANSTVEIGGSGSIRFTRNDVVDVETAPPPGARVEGTFEISLDSGETLTGAFDTAVLPVSTPPARGGTQTLPAWLGGDCAKSVFCGFAVDSDRETWLAVPVVEGAKRTLAMDDGADLTVYDTDGTTSLCFLGSSSEQCTVTAGGDTLYVDISGHGGEAPRLGLAMSEPWVELALGNTLSGTIPAKGYQWYHVGDLPETGSYLATARPQDDGFGSLSVLDGGGNYLVGNGWCCFPGNAVHDDFVPEVGDELWIRMDGDVGHAFQVSATSVPSGETASEAVPHNLPTYADLNGFDTFNHVFSAGEVLYVSFTTSWPGGWRVVAEGMDWTDDKAPVDFQLFTDPDDETGSRVQTGEGDGCTSQWLEDAQRYEARCLAILQGFTTYYMRLEETGGDTGALTVARLEPPYQVEIPIAVGQSPSYTLGQDEHARVVGYTDPSHGYRIGLDHPGSTSGGYGIFSDDGSASWGNGFGGAGTPGFNEAWRVRGADAAPAMHMDVQNWDASGASLSVTLHFEETGTGDSATDPFALDTRGNTVLYDDTTAGGDAYFAYTAPDSGQFEIEVSSVPWGGVPRTAVDYLLYTNPSDPDGSKVLVCQATYDSNADRWDAVCQGTLNGGFTYYLRATERSGVGGAPYQIRFTNVST